ncbi:MAG: glutamate synthase [Chloroflexi bacterium]|nr:glutamate synthase [Chloroflexota bacterium]MAQ57737.1 glutamate synthase [Chloroflexota bacterium]|tara:strand:- start:15312 stop:15554 length:243 start_codon:yes stop_codon:yes gene_type:complete
MKELPVIAQKDPYIVNVEEGKSYLWCSCGRSEKQPFCDSSHRGTEFKPVKYTAEADEEIYFCGCKNSSDQPLCDDTHFTL